MDLTINLTGIQENSKYVLEFSLSRDGNVVVTNTTQDQPPSIDDGKPSLDNIEKDNKPTLDDKPTMSDTKPKKSYKDFKVTSNIDDKKLKE